MIHLDNQSQELLERILDVQSESYNQDHMLDFIIEEATTIYPDALVEWDTYGNVYITKRTTVSDDLIVPAIVSHVDTVHRMIDDKDYRVLKFEVDGDCKYSAFNTKAMQSTGIGGDDKCGIFVCLEALRHLDDVKVAFFKDEEVGCLGSAQADLTFFDDCGFVLQADRKGNHGIANGMSSCNVSSSEFQEDVLAMSHSLGYSHFEFEDGGLTDVMELSANGLKLSVANFACGYYSPHTDDEWISYNDLTATAELMLNFATTNKKYEFEYEEIARPKYKYRSAYTGYNYKPTTVYNPSKEDVESEDCMCTPDSVEKVIDSWDNTKWCLTCFKQINK